MKKAALRSLALGAARDYLRKQGIDPAMAPPAEALSALDDNHRIDADTLASQWYGDASANQINLFKKEWIKWQKLNQSMS